jgi:phage I-like protein
VEGTTLVRNAVRAQAVQLAGRVMFREMLALTPRAVKLADGTEFEFEALTPDGITGEMNVAIEGEWMGHPAGPFSMDADKMQQCITRFEQQQNPLVVDYEHNSVQPGGDGRAAGWIHKLELRSGPGGAELWAMTEWTAKAADMIRSGEYRYCSPVIDFGGKDRESGEHVPVELFNVAITNNPFLDGMHPIALSRVAAAAAPGDDDEQKPDVEINVQPGEQEPAADGDEGAQNADAPPAEGEEGDDEKPEPEGVIPDPAEGVDPSKTTEGQLSAFVDAVCATSGGSKAAVLGALNDISDQVGGLVRNRLDTTDGSASDAQEIPMSKTTDDKSSDNTAPAADQDLRQLVVALTRTVGDMRAEQQAAQQAAADAKVKADADAKVQLEAQNAARIDAMVNDGRLGEGERETARMVLSAANGATMFENLYGRRQPGDGSPVGRRQASATGDADGARDDKQPAVSGDEEAFERDLAKLDAQQRKTFDSMVSMGKDRRHTLRRILNTKGREGFVPQRRTAN